MEHADLVVVREYGNCLEAELGKGALEAAGIPAMIQGDTAGGLVWSGAGFKILVREEDAAEALEVLTAPADADADFEADREHQPPWRRFT
jgi:hypothetical protein